MLPWKINPCGGGLDVTFTYRLYYAILYYTIL
jgi:hypothetical protein